MKLARLDDRSARLFDVGLAVTAFLMPLDRLPAWLLRPLSIISLLLLGQRLLVTAYISPRTLLDKRVLVISAAFAAIGVAIWASTTGALDTAIARSSAYILSLLLVKAWLIATLASPSSIKRFVYILLAVTGVVVIFGWFQMLGDLAGLAPSFTHLLPQYTSSSTYVLPRPQAWALEPLYLANFLLISLGFMTGIVLITRRARPWLTGLYATTVLLLLATVSRGAILGLLVMLGLTLLYFLARRRHGRLWLAGGVAGFAVMLAVAAGYAIYQYHRAPVTGTVKVDRTISAVITHYFDVNDRSANTRYELWFKASQIVTQHARTGVGFYNSRLALHEADWQNGVPFAKLQPFNNDYLAWIVETGAVGAVCGGIFLILIGYAVWKIFANPSALGIGSALALVAIAVQANTFHSILLLRAWVVIALVLALYRLSSPPSGKLNEI